MSEYGKILDDRALDILFREGRTYNGWQDREVSDVLLQALYDLMKWGPTSGNCTPARIKFVRSQVAKEKLKPHLWEGNVEKTMAAPAIAVLAFDLEFYEYLPRLFPHNPAMKEAYIGKEKLTHDTAFRNGSLQGGYFIMAARALGLDCGPMSGFNKKGVKEAFFPDQNVEINFLCNLGFGDPASLYPRGPRFEFDEVCEIL